MSMGKRSGSQATFCSSLGPDAEVYGVHPISKWHGVTLSLSSGSTEVGGPHGLWKESMFSDL